MKFKFLIGIQILLILAILTFGGMLDGDRGSDTLRTMHRIGSMTAMLASIATLVGSFKLKQNVIVKVLAVAALASLFAAAFAGSELDKTTSYTTLFDIMRGAGALSLLSSIGLLTAHLKSKK